MKIVKILLNHTKNMSEETIKTFIYKNMSAEMIAGLEYDDPKTIERALKLLGIPMKAITNIGTGDANTPKSAKDMTKDMPKTASAS